jgi:hypothetical protein
LFQGGLEPRSKPQHDQATNKQWEQIKRTHRGERDVEALYALRVKLCRQVDAGTLSVRKATELFEAERERVIKERQEYNRWWKASVAAHK